MNYADEEFELVQQECAQCHQLHCSLRYVNLSWVEMITHEVEYCPLYDSNLGWMVLNTDIPII